MRPAPEILRVGVEWIDTVRRREHDSPGTHDAPELPDGYLTGNDQQFVRDLSNVLVELCS